MTRIEEAAWRTMVGHAERIYPNECCGAMLGSRGETNLVTEAIPLENVAAGPQRERYELHPDDLVRADREASRRGLELVGIYHSHPDCDAYFSKTDLKNSCPWYSFVVLSIRSGKFADAGSFLPDAEQTGYETEELIWPKS